MDDKNLLSALLLGKCRFMRVISRASTIHLGIQDLRSSNSGHTDNAGTGPSDLMGPSSEKSP